MPAAQLSPAPSGSDQALVEGRGFFFVAPESPAGHIPQVRRKGLFRIRSPYVML